MQDPAKLTQLQANFRTCTQILSAIGDETRQLIVLAIIQSGCDGLRVGDITAQTHLSRPAVSHHLRILKEAGIVKLHKEATKNYYYLDPTVWLGDMKKLITQMEDMLR